AGCAPENLHVQRAIKLFEIRLMRCAVWIGFIWRFQDHYAAELLPRTQSLKEDTKIPVAQAIANEQKTRSGERLLYDLGKKIRFGGYMREKGQVIVFGQDERFRDIKRAMQMEYQGIGRRWLLGRFVFENGLHVLQNVLPSADLATCVFQFPFESADHEIVIIGRDDNRQWKTIENAMRFTGVPKLWRLGVFWRTGCAQDFHNVLFWRVWVGLHSRVLRNTHEIS